MPAGDRPQKRRRSAEEEEEETLDRELQAITREVLDLGMQPVWLPAAHFLPFVRSFIHSILLLTVFILLYTLSGATQFKRKKQKRAYEERKIISLGGQVMAVALLYSLSLSPLTSSMPPHTAA